MNPLPTPSCLVLLIALSAGAPAQEGGVEEQREAAPAPPKDETLLRALPDGAIAFAETSGLGQLMASIKNSPAYQTILASPQFEEFQTTEEFEKLQDGLSLAEFVLRMDLWEAGEKLIGGRVGFALYPKEEGENPDVVFLLRPADPGAWSKQRIWTDPLLGLAAKRLDRRRFNWGLKVWETKGEKETPVFVALHKEWLAISTSLDLLEKTISLQVNDPDERVRRGLQNCDALAKSAQFEEMSRRVGEDHLARILVDTGAVSKLTGGRLGLPEKMDNPLASLIAGGALEMAAHSRFATVTVDAGEEGLLMEASFDGDPAELDERFQVFFSGHPESGTPGLPEVEGLIGGVTFYRDIATWYRSRDELLVEEVLPEFDKFEAGVGNLLPGKDIGEDVLPLLGNNVTFLSALQNYDHLKGEPGVKFPGFAFIVELKEADEATDIFQLFFQTLLSVLNIEAGQQNRQPWLIDVVMHEDVKITTARYLEDPEGEDLPVVFNFLPASARVGNKYIVSSSLELCRGLVDAVRMPGADKLHDRNIHFEVRFQALADILAANSEHFEAQRVGEGRTAQQARADVELFLSLLRGLDALTISTSAGEEGFKLRLQGKLGEGDH